MNKKSSPSKLGSLSTKTSRRTGGKNIDQWRFIADGHVGSLSKNKNAAITFDVSMLREKDDTIAFYATTTDIPASRWNEGGYTDIMVLRACAEAAARKEFNLHHGIVWSQWLEVRVDEGRPYPGDTQAIASVAYRPISRGDAPDGTAYSINDRGHLIVFPKSVGVDRNPSPLTGNRAIPGHDGKSLAGLMNRDSRSATTQFTYLPDTPENRAGLDSILKAISQVNERLQSFLAPDAIQKTLERAISSGSLLLTVSESESEISSKSPSRSKP